MKLIDAEELYNKIRTERDFYEKRLNEKAECNRELFYCEAFQIVLYMIERQRIYDDDHTIDAALGRHGEWVEDDYGFFHCSECDFEFDDPEVKTPCCQNCGAIMTNYVNDKMKEE